MVHPSLCLPFSIPPQAKALLLIAAHSNPFACILCLFWVVLVCVILFVAETKNIYIYMYAEANVIYLETPAGVGYSYSADAAYYQGVDDKMTGTD